MPGLVIFDCDGVLIDSEVISARMLIAALARHGVTVDRAYVARHFLGRSFPTVVEKICSDFAVDLPEAFEATFRADLLARFERELRIMPGVPAMLAALQVPVWLATSSSAQRLRRSLEIVGLTGAFAGRTTTASEVPRGKPAPDLFLRAAACAGVAPAACVVIEDSRMGLVAARAAEMRVLHFTGGSHLRGLPADALAGAAEARFHDFAELPALLPDAFAVAGTGR